ncbi:hypothetical protein GALMADRAFT_234305 [Galerina marginata CBS 339.88]|uniref:Uncharacterized protein n=1 Tax=Galerina marginata (strain CBS 339.88) TaxID=685588 RepID=A0A067TT28_GALM3|nr:hypothetical protein GALMADRAFT_234305 [Galerina marginata CBS 339.88]
MENTQIPITEDDIFTPRDPSSQWAPPSRIHFPANESISTRPTRHRPEGPKVLQSGLTPPIRRGSPLNPQNANQTADARRRPWPPDILLTSPDVSSRHRRSTSLNLERESAKELNAIPDGEQEVGVFSDEYDLSHEDPRILQDVQRALKLKARREARLKRETVINSNKPSSPGRASHAALEIHTPPKLPLPQTFSPSPSFSPSTSRKRSTSTVSDVDFSPSTGVFDLPIQRHPVPFSTDNGLTLDWTGTHSDDGDRRWMGIGKKKEKDRLPPLGLMLEQQEQAYEAKLLQIRQSLSAQSSRKADIISDQLGRRYNVIYDSIAKTKHPLNLASVARWYGSQQETVRSSLEKAEPFTWLRHLDKRTTRTSRSPRCFSALIIEKYVQSDGRHNYMQTIPEDIPGPTSNAYHPRKSRSPSFLSASRAHGLGSSVSMALPTDDRISFQPFAESKRNSVEALPRRSVDSAPNSLHSGSYNPIPFPVSPISTRSNDFDIKGGPTYRRSRSPGSSSSQSSDESLPSTRDAPMGTTPFSLIPEVSIRPPSSENIRVPGMDPVPLTLTPSNGSSGSSQTDPAVFVADPSISSFKGSLKRRGTQMSLHNADHRARGSKKSRQDKESLLRHEYETKAHLLNETVAHNNRIRQFLNRISAAMKDFDSIQNTSMQNQGIQKISIPRDLLEALGHDPSAVTGATRRDRGWRAVEDIHQRVHKQRNVFRSFLDSFAGHPTSQGCQLDVPLEGIIEALEQLQQHKAMISEEADKVSELLSSVQDLHTEVKGHYNSTVSHVSIVYPELSTIIALEESYKDQYQHFWELGMDALTLLLDTVTPVWRTYGKTIGEDVRDFLIIPLYRNEFTGETKSYPIESFPKRSPGHWFGLVFFFLLSIAINILQVRAAISSSLNCRLLLIPYDGIRWTALPFFWIGIVIQWLAAVFEFAVVFLQLGVITWWFGWSVKLLV